MLRKDWNYRRGDIYLADLGEHRGNIQGGVRPGINIQNNSGNFFGPTLIVVPLTTELKKLGQPTHCVLEKQHGLNETSMSEAEQIVTINNDQFEFVYIADRRRVTKDSFERWYAGQSKYRKLCDRSPEEIMAIERKQQEAVKPRLKVDETKAAFTLQEAAVLLDLTYNEVRRLIQTGEIEAKKYGLKYLIPRDDIKWFLFQQKLEREN